MAGVRGDDLGSITFKHLSAASNPDTRHLIFRLRIRRLSRFAVANPSWPQVG
jgi:hypothetical protein